MTHISETLLKRTGGWYIVLSVAISQVVGLLGAIPGLVSIQLNVALSGELGQLFQRLVPALILVSQATLLAFAWYITPNARRRLDAWMKGNLRADADREFTAWKEITSLVTRYGIGAMLVALGVNVLPPFIIALSGREVVTSVFQPSSVSSPIPIYILLGGLAAALGSVILSLLTLERLTLPSRLILLPSDFETQLKARAPAFSWAPNSRLWRWDSSSSEWRSSRRPGFNRRYASSTQKSVPCRCSETCKSIRSS